MLKMWTSSFLWGWFCVHCCADFSVAWWSYALCRLLSSSVCNSSALTSKSLTRCAKLVLAALNDFAQVHRGNEPVQHGSSWLPRGLQETPTEADGNKCVLVDIWSSIYFVISARITELCYLCYLFLLCFLIFHCLLLGTLVAYRPDRRMPTMCIVTGTLRSSPVPWLPVLSNIEPPTLRHKAALDNLIEKTNLHAEWPLYNYVFSLCKIACHPAGL